MSTNNYDGLEQIKQLSHTNTRQEPTINNRNYPNSVKLTQENARHKSRMKQLEREKK